MAAWGVVPQQPRHFVVDLPLGDNGGAGDEARFQGLNFAMLQRLGTTREECADVNVILRVAHGGPSCVQPGYRAAVPTPLPDATSGLRGR